MKCIWISGLIAALMIASAGIASAHTPCCEGKACPDGKVAVPGETPADAKCCTDPSNASTCSPAANAGWACNGDAATNLPAIPERQGFAGCIDLEAVCAGGSVTPAGPAGCIGLGVQFIAGSNPMASPEDCTNASVDACCAADACVPFVEHGD